MGELRRYDQAHGKQKKQKQFGIKPQNDEVSQNSGVCFDFSEGGELSLGCSRRLRPSGRRFKLKDVEPDGRDGVFVPVSEINYIINTCFASCPIMGLEIKLGKSQSSETLRAERERTRYATLYRWGPFRGKRLLMRKIGSRTVSMERLRQMKLRLRFKRLGAAEMGMASPHIGSFVPISRLTGHAEWRMPHANEKQRPGGTDGEKRRRS
jgi:hypothetical protein